VTLNWPLEQEGATGENVRSVQYLLNDHGSALAVDGDFGAQTSAAVRAFQASGGLAADGIVGNQTWPALIVQLSAGSSSQIHSRSGWLTIDGILGPETESAARFFQEDTGLSVDGIVGPRTWNALVSGYLRDQGGQAVSRHVFQAWTRDDRASASEEATPQAVNALFARTWQAADGWNFDQCDAGAGSFFCTWRRAGEQLILQGNDNTGAPFYYVTSVTFQP
jgi:Putative peptidoglycan binding domain